MPDKASLPHFAEGDHEVVMVTHNANLAVCCDAEQVIHAEFDRSGDFALTYTSGAIESTKMDKSVLDVLEGTTPAFDNRRDKYLHSMSAITNQSNASSYASGDPVLTMDQAAGLGDQR